SFLFSYTYPAPSQLYTLSLHDALPISIEIGAVGLLDGVGDVFDGRDHRARRHSSADAWHTDQQLPERFLLWRKKAEQGWPGLVADRKSTRLNSSHRTISYAVFCLKKKK